jgi:hypothetical protein
MTIAVMTAIQIHRPDKPERCGTEALFARPSGTVLESIISSHLNSGHSRKLPVA